MRDRDLDDAQGAVLFRCTKQAVNRMRRHFDDPTRLAPGRARRALICQVTQGEVTPASFETPAWMILKGIAA